MKKIITLWALCLLGTQLSAQTPGCPDPLASNYNAAATINDGSCLYPPTSYTPTFVYNLSSIMSETSGLISGVDHIWTHNDSEGEPILYKINRLTGEVMKEVTVSNAVAIDWEAISEDDHFIYIGDFGNNSGGRGDLKIYKIRKSDAEAHSSVVADSVTFVYSEQTDFSPEPGMAKYDAEAFVLQNDSFFIFTKNWATKSTDLYVFPNVNAHHEARYLSSFNCDGLITDATFNREKNAIVLLGYKEESLGTYSSFAYLLYDWQAYDYLSGNKRRIELGSVLTLGQTEGISITEDMKGYISGEAIIVPSMGIDYPAKMHSFDFGEFISSSTSSTDDVVFTKLAIFPNPTNDHLTLSRSFDYEMTYTIHSISGQIVLSGCLFSGEQTVNIQNLPAGQYIFSLSKNTQLPFIKL